MTEPQTKSSGVPRRGHEFIEGTLDTPLLQYDLMEQIKQLRQEASWGQETGRSAKTLVKHPDLRVVLTAMKAKTKLHDHRTYGRISVQTLVGHIRLHLRERVVDLPAGSLVALDQCLEHDVEAIEESAFLLSICWPPEAEIERCGTSEAK